MKKNLPFALLVFFLAPALSPLFAMHHYYVAPESHGDGTAADPENPAGYLDKKLWDKVQQHLQTEPVTVNFLPGEYSSGVLTLSTFGHPVHHAVLQGDESGGTLFTGNVRRHVQIRGAMNMTLRHFHFTGETQNFAMHIVGHPADNPVEDVVIENCSFVDLNIADRGAIGIAGNVTELVVQGCHFERVGESAHAHMVYSTTSGPGAVRFYENHFIDTPGDYLRLRNRHGYAEIIGNTFVSNSVRDNRPFVALIAFSQPGGPQNIGDNVLIEGNHFKYHPIQNWSWDRGIAVCLSAYGHDPETGRRYMLSPEEANVLQLGGLEERRAFLREVMHINPETIVMRGNTFENVRYPVGFGSRAAEGHGHGWTGYIDLSPVVDFE